MANEARLNLEITAEDKARSVIEDFANTIRSAFSGLDEFTGALNMDGMESSLMGISEAAMASRTALEESINGMKQSADTLSVSMTESADKSVQAFRSLEENLNNVSTQIQDSLDQIGQSANHMDESLDFQNLQMAGQMIQDVGEQITGFFENAVSSAADFDQNVVNTTASLDANLGAVKLNTQQINAMQNAAIRMGESGFYSANQVAEAMNTMSRNGLTYQQIMTGGIDTVYKVAAANQSDIEQTANVVSDIYNEMGSVFRETGMSANQAAQMIGNSMTVAMHHARISMDDFMNAMKYVGPEASAMGVGIKDVSALISTLGQHAIRGSQAGTTLRTMLTNLTPVSKAAAAEMKSLGMITADGSNIFFDATGHMKSMSEVQQILHDKLGALTPQMQEMAIKTIFGRYALSGMTAIVDTAPSKFQSLTAAMNNNSTMTDIMKEKSTGLGMQIQQLNAHWQTVEKTIGEALKPVVESLIGGLNGLMKAWEGLSPGTRQAIVIFSAISGVLLLVGGGFLALVGTIGMFTSAFMSGMGVLGAIAGVIMGPVGIIIAAVALIGIAAYEIYAHWSTVKGWLSAAWNAIANTAKSVWNGITSFFKQWGTTILAVLVPVLGIPLLIAQHWGQITSIASEIFNAAINGIKNIWTGAVSWIGGVAQNFVNIIVNAFNWMYDHNYYFQDLVDFIRSAWNTITNDATTIWNSISSFLASIWNTITSVAKSAWNGLISALTSLWNSAVNTLRSVFSPIASFFSGIWNNVRSATSSAWSAISSTMSSLANSAVNGVKSVFNGLGSFFSGLWGQAFQWGSNLINMVGNGIKSAAGAVGNAVKSVASTIAGFLGFHSPAKEGPGADADVWMPNLMKMLTTGVQDHAPQLQMAVNSVALGLKTGVTSVNNTVHQSQISIPSLNSQQRQQPVINVYIDGRSQKTDNDLVDLMAKKVYSQMAMVK